jgi:hypothetical protein
LAFRFEEMISAAVFELFDLQGKKIMTKIWEGDGKQFRQLSVSHFRPGMYYYRLKNGSNSISNKLLIVR